MDDEDLVDCPACGEPTAIDIASAADGETFIVDSSVCCRPMTVRVETNAGERWANLLGGAD